MLLILIATFLICIYIYIYIYIYVCVVELVLYWLRVDVGVYVITRYELRATINACGNAH